MTFNDFKAKVVKAAGAVKRFSIRFGKAAWAYIKKAKLELIVIAAVILVDQISKIIINATMDLYETVVLIPKFLEFYYTHNDKAAFGSVFGLDKLMGGTGAMIFLIVLTFIAVAAFSYFMYRSRGSKKLCVLSYALIIGGAVGNLIDRLAFFYVRDFIQIVFFGLKIFGHESFAIFNIADMALVFGVIMFAVYYIFIYKDPKEEAKKAAKIAATAGETDEVLYEEDEAETGNAAEPNPAPEPLSGDGDEAEQAQDDRG